MQTIVKITAITLAVLLVGCGGSNQDESSGGNTTQFNGVAIDGYVARVDVYLDMNNNSRIDSFEPAAFTDDDGYFSYNPKTQVNYCSSTATKEQAIFCLNTDTDFDSAIIRIKDGYDLSTGLPFAGSLSAKITSISEGQSISATVTPITTLFTEIDNSAERQKILTALGITEEELSTDFLAPTDENGSALTDGSGNEVVVAKLVNVAQKLHKVISAVSQKIERNYSQIGEDDKLPSEAAGLVYKELAKKLSEENSEFTIDQVLTSSVELTRIVAQAEEEVKILYEINSFNLPAELVTDLDSSAVTDIVTQAAAIPAIVDKLVSKEVNAIVSKSSATGVLRAVEVLSDKIAKERDTSEITRLTALLNNDSSPLRDSFLEALADDLADVSALTTDDLSFTEEAGADAESIAGGVKLPRNAVAFSSLVGKQIRISDPNLESGTHDAEVIFYFDGTSDTAISGTLHACVKFIDGVVNGELGSDSTTGQYSLGDWKILTGSGSNSTLGYSLLARLEFSGLTYQTIIKSSGVDSQGQFIYRFDLDDGLEQWTSAVGIVSQAISVPITDAGCKAELLPLRVTVNHSS